MWGNFRHFEINFFLRKLQAQISCFLKKIAKKKNKKIEKNHRNSSQLPAVWKDAQDFVLSYFEYRHIWLNIFMNFCHLSNITKLKKALYNFLRAKERAPNPKRCRETLNTVKKLVGLSPPLPPSYGSEFANRCCFFSAAHSLVSLYEVFSPLSHPCWRWWWWWEE